VAAENLRDFLQWHCICPFARQLAAAGGIEWHELQYGILADPIPTCSTLRSAFASFANSASSVLVVTFDEQFTTHDDAHLAAKRTFLEMGIATTCAADHRREPDEVRRIWLQRYWVALADRRACITEPTVLVRDQRRGVDVPYFVFMMNELYPIAHIRFSPRAMMIATKHADLAWARRTRPDEVNSMLTKIVKDDSSVLFEGSGLYMMPFALS
jgi:hypothetical protein